METKKIIITVTDTGIIELDIQKISNDFEILGILKTALSNIEFLISEKQNKQ